MPVIDEAWAETMSTAFAALRPTLTDADSAYVTGSLRSAELGRFGIFDVRGTPQALRRTRSSIRSASADLVKICIQRSGSATVHQDGTEVRVGPGEMTVYDMARPYQLCLAGAWRSTVMTVPHEAMSLPWSVVSQAMKRSIPVRTGSAAVLAHLIDEGLASEARTAGEASVLDLHCGEAGLRLLESAMSVPDGASPVLGAPHVGDQRRAVIRSWIIEHARRPRLTHDDVARAHCLSARSLHRLFESEVHSVAQLIRQARLAGARADLIAPPFSGHSVATIAARWGFADQSHFTRTFRAAFGQSPEAYRRDAGRVVRQRA